jgi:hypothetical protein
MKLLILFPNDGENLRIPLQSMIFYIICVDVVGDTIVMGWRLELLTVNPIIRQLPHYSPLHIIDA